MKRLTSLAHRRVPHFFRHETLLLLPVWLLAAPHLAAQSPVMDPFRAQVLAFSQSPVNTPGPNRPPQPHGAAGIQGLLPATNYRLSYWSKTTEPANVLRRWSIPLAEIRKIVTTERDNHLRDQS